MKHSLLVVAGAAALGLLAGCGLLNEARVSDEAVDAIVTADSLVLASGDTSNGAGEKVFRGEAFIIKPPGQTSAESYIESEIQRLGGLGWAEPSEIDGVDYISDPQTDSVATFRPLSIVDAGSTSLSLELADEVEKFIRNCGECVFATVSPVMT